MRQTDEDKILLGFNNGKEQAYKVIFDLYYEELFKYAYFFIKNSQEAEDTVLISFRRLFSIPDKRFTSISAIRTYIFKAVKFYSFNAIYRIKTRDGYYDDYKDHLASSISTAYYPDIELFDDKSDAAKALRKIVEKLPGQCKRIFKMIFFDEKEPEEIAKELGITIQTVYSQKSRALSFIKKNIDQNGSGNNKTPANH